MALEREEGGVIDDPSVARGGWVRALLLAFNDAIDGNDLPALLDCVESIESRVSDDPTFDVLVCFQVILLARAGLSSTRSGVMHRIRCALLPEVPLVGTVGRWV